MSRGMNHLGSPAGEYDQRVTVWKNKPTTNPDGQQIEVPVEFIERWVKVEPIGGTRGEKEQIVANQTQAHITHRLRMRSDTQSRTIDETMWITLRDGTRLDITRIIDVDVRKVELEIECNRRV